MIDKNAVARCFGKAAASYDQHAILQRLSSEQLLQHLPGLLNNGVYDRTVDLGCGSGALLPILADCSKQLIAVDLSFGMLAHAQQHNSIATPTCWLNGDAEALPLLSNSVHLCVSNLALQWCDDLATPLIEVARCLKQGGLMLFSTLVSGSLDELTQSWSSVNSHRHVNRFLLKAVLNKRY